MNIVVHIITLYVCVNYAVCVCVFAAEFVSVSDSKSRFLLKRFKVSTSSFIMFEKLMFT